MADLQKARATAESHLSRETTRQFDVALHSAALNSIQSMTELHRAVCDCVIALKAANVSAVDMILTMKTHALDSAERYRPTHDEIPATSVNTLMDQIVKWAIAEYFTSRS